MTNWQPISTAPKDGRYVLLYCRRGTGYGWNDEGVGLAFWGGVGEMYGNDPGWYHSECDSNKMTDFNQEPTHWAPLPEPPVD